MTTALSLLHEVQTNQELQTKLQAVENESEFRSVAAEYGFELTDEVLDELAALANDVEENEELTDDQLEQVAAGWIPAAWAAKIALGAAVATVGGLYAKYKFDNRGKAIHTIQSGPNFGRTIYERPNGQRFIR